MANLICPKCLNTFNSELLRTLKCPDCRKWLESAPETGEEKHSVEVEVEAQADELDEFDGLEIDTRAVIAASNRTTHAVRSLSLFFFTLLRWNLFGGGLIGIGLALSPFNSYLIFQTDRFAMVGPGLFIAGSLISFIGFFVAISRGMRELTLSKP
jgi:uncharacterized protein YbaR (Trm112 family)